MVLKRGLLKEDLPVSNPIDQQRLQVSGNKMRPVSEWETGVTAVGGPRSKQAGQPDRAGAAQFGRQRGVSPEP